MCYGQRIEYLSQIRFLFHLLSLQYQVVVFHLFFQKYTYQSCFKNSNNFYAVLLTINIICCLSNFTFIFNTVDSENL